MNVLVSLFNSLPGAAGQGLIWGIMAIGVYITYKILDVADLTVDGSFCTGAAVFVMLFTNGRTWPWPCWRRFWPVWRRDWSQDCSIPSAGFPPFLPAFSPSWASGR